MAVDYKYIFNSEKKLRKFVRKNWKKFSFKKYPIREYENPVDIDSPSNMGGFVELFKGKKYIYLLYKPDFNFYLSYSYQDLISDDKNNYKGLGDKRRAYKQKVGKLIQYGGTLYTIEDGCNIVLSQELRGFFCTFDFRLVNPNFVKNWSGGKFPLHSFRIIELYRTQLCIRW